MNLNLRRNGVWSVLFTDGSVQFSRLAQSVNGVSIFSLVGQVLCTDETVESYEQYDQVFALLEQDH
jgi:hypothetical protein